MLGLHLSVFWTLYPQYQFGWLVPPLVLYFFLRRWSTLPPDEPANHRGAIGVMIGCALLLLPTWWIRIATPDWSVISTLLASLVTLFTLAFLAHRGGWILAWRLAFPVLFIFCAVPWPPRLEQPLIQGLMRMVAIITVEALQWLGIAAIRTGNLVSLTGGTIDIAEACSGIRSLQSMLMAALALGEVRRMSLRSRMLLLAAGMSLAIFFNLIRNFSLAVLAHYHGISAIGRWHDTGGWGILIVSFCFLTLLASRLDGTTEQTPTIPLKLRPFPRWAGTSMALWFCTVIIATEGWYRLHDTPGVQRIEIDWPTTKSRFRINPIAEHTRELLRCSSAQIVSWSEPDGTQWAFGALRWAPGKTSTQSARTHSPEVCLPAAGKKWIRNHPPQHLEIRGGELLFKSSEFEFGPRRAYVFFTLYEEAGDMGQSDGLAHDWSRWSRIQRALIGQRNLGQQSLEIVVSGASSYDDALRAVRNQLPYLAHFEKIIR
ncbi:MAG: exosortase/archaeosortase family protein, partial [Verrucomicrobiota bacterium]